MPIDLQAKLLRVLESGRMTRIGGTAEIPVDVRIVTATNRTPDVIVRDRRLREDLFYRLAVFVVQLPPLRRRAGDVELLAEAFLAQLNDENGTSKRFDRASLAEARAHPWPGNVRELKNCVERSYVLSDAIVKLDVQPTFDISDTDAREGDCVQLPIGMSMADAERELLLATLRHCGGNKRRTADVLGVSLKTVYNKLVGYGNGHACGHGPVVGGRCRMNRPHSYNEFRSRPGTVDSPNTLAHSGLFWPSCDVACSFEGILMIANQ